MIGEQMVKLFHFFNMWFPSFPVKFKSLFLSYPSESKIWNSAFSFWSENLWADVYTRFKQIQTSFQSIT